MKSTIADLFFLFQKKHHFVTFFESCKSSPDHCGDIISLLHSLARCYLNAYEKHVSTPSGCIEKRLKLGKLMILKFESNRDVHVAEHSTQFKKLPCIRNFIEREQTDVNDQDMHEDSDLLYGIYFLKSFSTRTFGSGEHKKKGLMLMSSVKRDQMM